MLHVRLSPHGPKMIGEAQRSLSHGTVQLATEGMKLLLLVLLSVS